ncbi:MAG: caspase family protein, partial [Cyanobacteria bacterium J06560_2]
MSELDFDHSLAVVIGIDAYQHRITPLQTAVADAQAIAHLLEQDHAYEVISLLDQQAQLATLRTLVHTTLPQRLSPNSRLLLYFAGHGIAQDGDDGPAGYLIPQDARAGKVDTYWAMRALHDALKVLPCRHFLAIFDCCFAGAFRWSSTRDMGFEPDEIVIHQERFDRFQQDPAWQVITSAAHDQKAADTFWLGDSQDSRKHQDSRDSQGNSKQKHSPFATALIQALTGEADVSPPARAGQPAGDGVITATELYLYLRGQVEIPSQSSHKRQTPGLCSLPNHDKGEYIFLTPGHQLNLPPAPELNRENNPYRGLESFDQKHHHLFFGRNTEIEQLLQRIEDPHPMVVVLGASGTGKSSLVKAGLLPKLENNRAFQVLPVIRPGNYPLKALAGACIELAEGHKLNYQLATDEGTLSALIGTWQQTHPNTKLLLVIDQAEELITQAHSPAAASQFQRLIKRAMSEHRDCLQVVATLRLDFEAQFQAEELRESWMDSRFVISPMSQAQLRAAIEKPAEARVLYFEPSSLVDKLIEDVAQTPGALPLLSFTLSELYLRYLERRSDDRALTEADYRQLGGVAGSLTRRATQEYESLVAQSADFDKTAMHVMLRMVAVEGGELARRRVPLSELRYAHEAENTRVQMFLSAMIAARLIVQGQ